MATTPTGTTTHGHEAFNDIEKNPQDYNQPGKLPPAPGPQPTGTSPLGGPGIPTGTRPPGWMNLFMVLLASYNTAYIASCLQYNRAPEPITEPIRKMLETQTDHLCAHYSKEISVARF